MRALGVVFALFLPALAVHPSWAASETGPNRLGLPGLASTITAPAGRGAPLRIGIGWDTATFDAEHGLVASLGTRDLSSTAYRLQLQLRASRRVVISASLPYRTASLEASTTEPQIDSSGLGDLDVAASARLFDLGPWTFGGWGALRAPTGDAESGLSTEKLDGEYGLTATGRFFRDGLAPELAWHVNVGYRFNKNENGYGVLEGDPRTVGAFFPSYPAIGDDEDEGLANDQLLLRTALEFRRRWGHLFLEFSHDWLAWFDDAEFGESASWFTPGIHVGNDDGPALTAAWSIGLFVDDAGTAYEPRLPDWRFELGVSVPIFVGGRDRDDDGIRDREDQCPDQPEDRDGFEDEDGCPDADNDSDGIADEFDRCPNLLEDFDGFEDEDGCPDLDNDLDGIADVVDGCPNQAEDYNGFQDEDGCPDAVIDRDGDGIIDAQDLCPDEPEDFDGFEDHDGCPEPDNDLDGIADRQDDCPNDPEDYDGVDDEDGCPDLDDE